MLAVRRCVDHITAHSELSKLDLVLNSVPAHEVRDATTAIQVSVRAAIA
jgi:hypothetical protein